MITSALHGGRKRSASDAGLATTPSPVQVFPMQSTYEHGACSPPQEPQDMGHSHRELGLEDFLIKAGVTSAPAGSGASAYSAPTAEEAENPDVEAPSPAQALSSGSSLQLTNFSNDTEFWEDCIAEPQIGGNQAKKQQKLKRKVQDSEIDLEGEYHKAVDAQNSANKDRKEMLGTQRCESSWFSEWLCPIYKETLETQMNAAKEQNELVSLNFFGEEAPSPAQAVSNGSSSRSINVDTNGRDCVRTKQRLPWTKEEDLILVSAWLSHSNDPTKSNYKKNGQFWEAVAAVYNNKIPKERERKVKQVKDHFEKIKKALKTYKEDHKNDGPFVFEHCWEVLHKEPKWDAYLTRLRDEPQTGSKQAKKQEKRKRKEDSVIDLEDERHKVVDAQNTANEGPKEMLEIQRQVSSGNLEASTVKEQKELVMLKIYHSLTTKDTTEMSEYDRSEHMKRLRLIEEKLFGKPE